MMKKNPYFSIVMPVKNGEEFIRAAIESMIAQTFPDWELIVVNDHSTDATAKIIRSMRDERIHLFDCPDHITGVGAVRDFGTKKASGEIILVADADDISYPFRLADTKSFFQTYPKTDIFYGNIDKYYVETGRTVQRWFQPFSAPLLREFDYIPNQAAAYRKRAYGAIQGYDARLLLGEDWDLWLQMLEKKMQFGALDKPLVKARKHTKSVRYHKNLKALLFDRFLREKHHLAAVPSLKQIQKLGVPGLVTQYTTYRRAHPMVYAMVPRLPKFAVLPLARML